MTWHLNQVRAASAERFQRLLADGKIPEPVYDETAMRYLVYQGEVTKDKGFHWQMYVEFAKTVGVKTLQKHFPGCAGFERKGTREQARDYCTLFKEDKSSIVIPGIVKGLWADGQGDRMDLMEACELALEGKTKEIDGPIFVKFHRGIAAFANLHKAVPLRREVKVHVWWGDSGCGKSHAAFAAAEALDPDCAVLEWAGEWADPYDGHKVVIFDEFDGTKLSADIFLRLCDKYRTTVNCKGTPAKHWVVEHIFITSKKHPREWFGKSRERDVLRRLTSVNHMTVRFAEASELEKKESSEFNKDVKFESARAAPRLEKDNVALSNDEVNDILADFM